MQLLHLPDTGQNVFAVIKIYLRALECYAGKQPPEWRWHRTLKMGASCFTWTKLPLALPSVFYWCPTYQSVQSEFIEKHTFCYCQASLPLCSFLLTLLVIWEIWVIGILSTGPSTIKSLQNSWTGQQKRSFVLHSAGISPLNFTQVCANNCISGGRSILQISGKLVGVSMVAIK